MKLLLDQNISRRLTPLIARSFPGTKHVSDVGLAGADDERIWRFARDRGYVIVSKDSDFLHRSTVRGHPPKVLQPCVGNASTEEVGKLLMNHRSAIRTFLRHREESLFVLR